MSAGQSLRAQPKPLAIVRQQFEGRAGPVAKHIDGPVQGIVVPHLATECGEPVYALAEVHGLHGPKDATLGREWEHEWESRNVCTKGTSVGAASLYVMRRRVPSGR